MKKIVQILFLIILGGILAGGFSAYREVSRRAFCSNKVKTLQSSNSQTDWNKQVPAAPLGFSPEIKTIPLSLAEETKCQREQKDFFFF